MKVSAHKTKKEFLDRVTIGSWISLGHPAIAEIFAKAGFDWLTIDLEHGVITISEAEQLIRVIELCGVVPFVRLSSNNPTQIKRVMDAGAHGVIVPMVTTAEEAQRAVSAVKYPPLGLRGVGLARAQGYGSRFRSYAEWLNSESFVIVQIEHITAVKNLKSIFEVPGVDAFIVGPYDLSGSLGIPGDFQHADFQSAMSEISSLSAELGIPGGVHVVEPDTEEVLTRMREGYRLIAYSVDIRLLDVGSRNGLEAIWRNQS